jgi:DNA-binding NtrC family response regulator
MRLLIVGTLNGQLTTATKIAMDRGATVTHAADIAQALAVLRSGRGADLLMVDVAIAIRDLVHGLEAEHIHAPIVACGTATDARAAVAAIHAGAKEYIPLPPDPELIAAVLAAVADDTRELIYRDDAMARVVKLALQVAPSDASVLITGESGTGKELVAKSIHAASPRAKAPFVAINCAAIPDTLLESELFGHVRGAFTGADPKGRIGKFELANGGTLFLDEIGDMPLYLQAKLLRVLEDFTITRIGSNQVVAVDVRILSATNQDLPALIRAGRFREDLYYRLHVVPLAVPPLRDRPEDIEDIALALVQSHARAQGREPPSIRPELMRRLLAHRWPGNVRELGNVLEFMLTMQGAGQDLTLEALPPTWRGLPDGAPEGALKASERQGERQAIALALAAGGAGVDGKRRAAARLGISLATLYRKLHLLGMTDGAGTPRR